MPTDMRPEGAEAALAREPQPGAGAVDSDHGKKRAALAVHPLVGPLVHSSRRGQPPAALLEQSKHDPSLNLIEVRCMVHSYSEFFAGYCAACTSITLLFPLNKLIFRQMLGSISFKEAFAEIRSEGLANFYRGLLPPLLQKSTSYSIMFGTQNEYYLMLKGLCDTSSSEAMVKQMSAGSRNVLITSVSGALAGLTEAVLTPFERVQALLQMQKYHGHYRHTWHVFEAVAKSHGPRELYRGLSAICMRNSLSNALFFSLRTPLKQMFPRTDNKFENSFYDFVNGGLLGAVLSTMFYPLNVIKSNMQAQVGGPFPGIVASFRVIFDTRGRDVRKFYKGVGSNFTRAILAWGITNSMYEIFLKYMKAGHDTHS